MPTTAQFFKRMNRLIESAGAKENAFYTHFREGTYTPQQLQLFVDQYFYYIRTFPQILAGLSARVELEPVRAELAKTVVSELGDGDSDRIHFRLFEKAIAPLGLAAAEINTVLHIPEADALVVGIRSLFLEGSVASALGGHYTIEETGLPMIASLYEGFRLYAGSTTESMEYFYLHLLVEHEHVAWISKAVEPYLATPEGRAEVEVGVTSIAALLTQFWQGIETAAQDLATAVSDASLVSA